MIRRTFSLGKAPRGFHSLRIVFFLKFKFDRVCKLAKVLLLSGDPKAKMPFMVGK